MKDKLENKGWFNNAIAIIIGIISYMILKNLPAIGGAAAKFIWYIAPLIYGLIIAYILAPMIDWISSTLFRHIKNRKAAYYISIALIFGAFFMSAMALSYLLIPQALMSFNSFIANIDSYGDNAKLIIGNTIGTNSLDGTIDSVKTLIIRYINDLSTDNVSDIGNGLIQFFIACIIAIYLLSAQRIMIPKIKTVLKLVLPARIIRPAGDFLIRCNDILSKYVICEIGDSVLVGLINAILMTVAGMPYVLLISIEVGITNLAPTFGPAIGLVIGFLIIFGENPTLAIVFVVIVAITQFIDAYIIKPKMFGSGLGVSGLAIIVSVIVGQRMFGIVGMLLAMPFAAMLKILCKDWIYPWLVKRNNLREFSKELKNEK